MQYYLAPMEGITTYIYRNAYARCFGHMDKYFTPFIASKKMNTREVRDILPENNEGIEVVPQILTNKAEDFLAIAEKIASYGYQTVNLNLGCPSGTVTAKKRGAGFLSIPDQLDAFLYEIYEKCPLRISVKTRIGISDLAEWDTLLDIYAKYPLEEIIIHTRLQQEFYTGKPHPEAYARAQDRLQHPVKISGTAQIPSQNAVKTPDTVHTMRHIGYSKEHSCYNGGISLCYNGDIISPDSLNILKSEWAALNAAVPDAVMLGRGILRNPGLAGQLRAQDHIASPLTAQPDCGINLEPCKTYKNTKQIWLDFHNEIFENYRKIMSGDLPVLFKMKDLWTYMSQSFTDSGKYLKKIRKADRISEYEIAVNALFREQEIIVS